jgi:hypothetical protein
VGGALAVADEVAALVERAGAPASGGPGEIAVGAEALDPIIVDLELVLDRLRETAGCATIVRVDQVAERFHRLPRRRAAQAQPGIPFREAAPELPKRAIVCAMNSIKAEVADCFARYQIPGIAMVNLVVTRQGTVSAATTTGKFAGTPTGDCVAAAAKTVTFPPSERMTFPYPFVLK